MKTRVCVIGTGTVAAVLIPEILRLSADCLVDVYEASIPGSPSISEDILFDSADFLRDNQLSCFQVGGRSTIWPGRCMNPPINFYTNHNISREKYQEIYSSLVSNYNFPPLPIETPTNLSIRNVTTSSRGCRHIPRFDYEYYRQLNDNYPKRLTLHFGCRVRYICKEQYGPLLAVNCCLCDSTQTFGGYDYVFLACGTLQSLVLADQILCRREELSTYSAVPVKIGFKPLEHTKFHVTNLRVSRRLSLAGWLPFREGDTEKRNILFGNLPDGREFGVELSLPLYDYDIEAVVIRLVRSRCRYIKDIFILIQEFLSKPRKFLYTTLALLESAVRYGWLRNVIRIFRLPFETGYFNELNICIFLEQLSGDITVNPDERGRYRITANIESIRQDAGAAFHCATQLMEKILHFEIEPTSYRIHLPSDSHHMLGGLDKFTNDDTGAFYANDRIFNASLSSIPSTGFRNPTAICMVKILHRLEKFVTNNKI
jgi:hypothetical protein